MFSALVGNLLLLDFVGAWLPGGCGCGRLFAIMTRLALLSLVLVVSACQDRGHYDTILALRDRIEANPSDSQSLDALLAYLPSKHWLDPANAAACFRQLADGPNNKRRVVPLIAPRVVAALVKYAEHVGRESTNALREYGEYVLPYKADLIGIIRKHPDEDIAWFAAVALGNLGPKASDALPVIEALPIYEANRHLIEDAIKNIKGEQ